jgi:hypothetical protein
MMIYWVDCKIWINFTVFIPQYSKFVFSVEFVWLFLKNGFSFLIFGHIQILHSLNFKAKVWYIPYEYSKYSYDDVLYTS